MESASDVFTDSGPTIVDCSILEAAKENIQPLASGRRVTTLANVLSKPPAQREAALASARRRLQTNVTLALEDYDPEDPEGADPLEAYANFVSWTLEHYAEGPSRASNLLPLLEEATRVLKDHAEGHWKQDPRYLKLWALYASFVERPEIIWRFLLANEIGTDLAAMYEGLATVLERERRTADADEIYLLGIARNADPVNRLKLKHAEFQKRLMAGIMSGPPPESSDADQPAAEAAPRRKVLGESKKKKTSRPADSDAESQPPPPPPAPAPSSRPNAKIQVFVDDTQAARSLGLPLSLGSEVGPSVNPFPELGTRVSRVKENTREVTKMGGTKIKQPKSGIPRPASRPAATPSGSRSAFAIFVDDGTSTAKEEVMAPPPVPAKAKPIKSVKTTKTTKKPTSSTKGKAKETTAPVFPVEEESVEVVPPSTPKNPFAPLKDEPEELAKPSFVPFVDEAQTSPTKVAFVPFRDNDEEPKTVAFTAFRDEPVTPSRKGLASGAGPDSVMKPKTSHGDDVLPTSSEAEALRKDPLKNYVQ